MGTNNEVSLKSSQNIESKRFENGHSSPSSSSSQEVLRRLLGQLQRLCTFFDSNLFYIYADTRSFIIVLWLREGRGGN